MYVFEGKKEAQKIDNQIRQLIAKNSDLIKKYKLAIIQVGDNPESNKYIELKKAYGTEFGINVIHNKIPADLNDPEVEGLVSKIVNDNQVGGVIVQLPLPRESLYKILDLIPVKKDIDALSSKSQDKFYNGKLQLSSPVVRATEYFISSIESKFSNKKAIVLGNGKLVGKPVAFFLNSIGFEVQTIENYEPNQPLSGDLIVLGAGIPNLVNANDINEGANVIDFGSTHTAGKIVGDLNRDSEVGHLGMVAFSPGGVGPLVVRFLFLNFLEVCF